MRRALLALTLVTGTTAYSADIHDHSGPSAHPASAMEPAGEHAMHHPQRPIHDRYRRTISHYVVPDVALIDSRGEPVRLRSLLTGNRPTLLNFIYTSCTTVCPIASATFAGAREQLARGQPAPLMVSISIDPEFDTPERLRDYAQRFHAEGDWIFLTGSLADITAVQRAFLTYRGDKMNHTPVTFIRGAASPASWVRIDGYTSSRALVREYMEIAHR